jgi:flavodoxin
MKTAVVFYSLDGNCAFAAEQIKTQLNADLIQLYTKDDKKRGKIGKMFWGVGMVFGHKKPPLKPYDFNPAAYDLIVIGAPVWAGSPAPPVQTFLSQTKISGKKAALFVCHAGGKGDALNKFKALLPGNEVVAEADFNNPTQGDKEKVKQQIEDWIKGIV